MVEQKSRKLLLAMVLSLNLTFSCTVGESEPGKSFGKLCPRVPAFRNAFSKIYPKEIIIHWGKLFCGGRGWIAKYWAASTRKEKKMLKKFSNWFDKLFKIHL